MSRLAIQTAAVAVAAFTGTLAIAQLLAGTSREAQAEPVVMAAVAAPAQPVITHSATVPMGTDGHFWVNASIEGRPLRLMVDTGATMVALTPADARRLGLDVSPEDYTRALRTANGQTRAAPVRLPSLAVGGARVSDVDAVVVESGLPHSLLGMSYLSRLSGFSATPAALTLNP